MSKNSPIVPIGLICRWGVRLSPHGVMTAVVIFPFYMINKV